ncbi:MAG: orotidine-5'-phosphate decarboxylase [Saprospiraceae bacterium]|nr:orotidine-5'-phosphate decarboxylase [Candidatus Vicinibacter affinis]
MFKDTSFLTSQIRLKKSFLCIGLDPDLEKMPSNFRSLNQPFFEFCSEVVRNTSHLAVAYKINIAFFETLGPEGWIQLEKLVKIIPEECLIIADAKRADIGNTSKKYAEYFFERLGADAVTLHPYMGVDSLEPFFQFKEKWSIILALTSNPGAADFELVQTDIGEYFFERILKVFEHSAFKNNIMYVVGATKAEYLLKVRQHCPNAFLLIPGVGEQGGDLKEVILNGRNISEGLLINVGRKILYPKSLNTSMADVVEAASDYQSQMADFF